MLTSLSSAQKSSGRRSSAVIRGALVRLLRLAYVDCPPYAPIQLPKKTRLLTGATATVGLPNSPAARSLAPIRLYAEAHLRSLNGVMHVSEVLSYCVSQLLCPLLNIHTVPNAQVDRNKLTQNVLDVCKLLLRFGAYDTVAEVHGLLTLVVDLLDGSPDKSKQSSEQEVS